MLKYKVIWLTGLSGAGKSTIAIQLAVKLKQLTYKVSIIDGDQLRLQYNDLGFSNEDRIKQMHRAIDLVKQKFNEDMFVIVALISPFESIRKLAREKIGQENFIEVYVNTPLSICEERDVKGLYKKARLGLIKNMTGIDSIYDAPMNPEITIDTSKEETEDSVLKILTFLRRK